MRNFSHLTPRYIRDRLGILTYERAHPDHPWLTKQANEMLATYLRKTDVGLEWGSGRSSIWFAKRVGHLTSVEHNRDWFEKVGGMLTEQSIENVSYHHFPKDMNPAEAGASGYVRVTDSLDPESLDFALIDGTYRDHCAIAVLDRIKPGGVMIIDNVERYLPSESHSPNARSHAQGARGAIWEEVAKKIAEWRFIWTSSGVNDTAFFFKPGS
jgi:predicted O-methyltransferase YrrM